MSEYGYNLAITADNNFAKVSRTIESIMKQEQAREFDVCVVVVDFASTDGTYDKLLDMAESYPMAVYQLKERRNGRTRIADASEFFRYQSAPGNRQKYLHIRAGDVLYKNAFIRTTELFMKYDSCYPALLATEIDVEDSNGRIYRYPSIQEETGIIDFEKSTKLALLHGYRNNIFCVGSNFSNSYQMADSLANERLWWNKLYFRLSNSRIIYSPNSIGLIQEIHYEDEIEEILLRWNVLIGDIRIKKMQNRRNLSESEVTGAKRQLALYSLWRGCGLLDRQDKKGAEDCFVLARMIDKTIVSTTEYTTFFETLRNSNQMPELKKLFDCGKEYVL